MYSAEGKPHGEITTELDRWLSGGTQMQTAYTVIGPNFREVFTSRGGKEAGAQIHILFITPEINFAIFGRQANLPPPNQSVYQLCFIPGSYISSVVDPIA